MHTYDVAKLERARREQGLRQQDLADRTGKSVSTIHKVLAGRSHAVRTVKLVADALGVPMDQVVVEAPRAKEVA